MLTTKERVTKVRLNLFISINILRCDALDFIEEAAARLDEAIMHLPFMLHDERGTTPISVTHSLDQLHHYPNIIKRGEATKLLKVLQDKLPSEDVVYLMLAYCKEVALAAASVGDDMHRKAAFEDLAKMCDTRI